MRLTDRAIPGDFDHERGDPIPEAPVRVAVIAHYSASPSVSHSMTEFTDALVRLGYHVVVASSSDAAGPLDWPSGLRPGVTVLRRPNVGYDFGSWAIVLREFPQIASAPYVILANDSMVGPFTGLRHLIDHFEASTSPVWGAVRSQQFHAHLQSYFVGYRGGILADEPLRSFWGAVGVEANKAAVIRRYELGLARALDRARIRTSAAYEGQVISGAENPAIVGWRPLLEAGFPFVKRELLINPEVVPDGGEVPEKVQQLYGEDVVAWL